MGYTATSITAPTVKSDTAEATGVFLFPTAIRLSDIKTIYKTQINLTNIDYILIDGAVHCQSGAYAKYLYFKIGGVTKATATASGETWRTFGLNVNDAYIDCTGITGTQDIEVILDDSTTNDAEVKNISISYIRS